MTSPQEAMERATDTVLGKRGRRTPAPDEVEVEAGKQSTAPKRSRTHASARDDTANDKLLPTPVLSTAKPRNGLLTPEPSILTESQIDPVATKDDEDGTPKGCFPFMKLPAELRIHIYHMALVREEPLLLHAERAPEPLAADELLAAPSTSRYWPAMSDYGTNRATAFHGNHRGITPFTPIRSTRSHTSSPERVPLKDPIVPEILRLNKQIYREARQVLYSDNVFTLGLSSGIHTLSTLHQRSRSLIKHVVLTIPSHHDILDGFADLVRLGLRYCWGLKTFKIILQASLPDDGRVTGATSVYANAFHILRWLPRGCKVGLDGNVSDTVKKVVTEEGRLQMVLDEVSHTRRMC
jgi:epsin